MKERIQADGAQIVEDMSFIDAGASGATLVGPHLERLRDAAPFGTIDRLYILSPDRLARKYAHQALLLDELSSCGVQVVFLNHAIDTTPEESLLLQMQGMIADDAERGIMQSRTAKVVAQLASQQHNAVHYPGSNNEAISASGALNRLNAITSAEARFHRRGPTVLNPHAAIRPVVPPSLDRPHS